MNNAELADEIERYLDMREVALSGTLRMSTGKALEIIAALRRQPSHSPLRERKASRYLEHRFFERQPSSDQVLVPRDIGELAQDMVATMKRQPGYKLAITHGRILKIAQEICRLYELSKLSAAEAEGRKT